MAGAPRFKVYDGAGKYQAATKETDAAAVLVSFYGSGATIRDGHLTASIVWVEGEDGEATESYDVVAEVVARRQRERAVQLDLERQESVERARRARELGSDPGFWGRQTRGKS